MNTTHSNPCVFQYLPAVNTDFHDKTRLHSLSHVLLTTRPRVPSTPQLGLSYVLTPMCTPRRPLFFPACAESTPRISIRSFSFPPLVTRLHSCSTTFCYATSYPVTYRTSSPFHTHRQNTTPLLLLSTEPLSVSHTVTLHHYVA